MYKLITETEAENIPNNFTGVAEHSNGYKEYWVNGKRHRDGGRAAVEYSNGAKSYWVNGKETTEAEAKHLAPSCNGKVVLIDGVEYKLTALNTP